MPNITHLQGDLAASTDAIAYYSGGDTISRIHERRGNAERERKTAKSKWEKDYKRLTESIAFANKARAVYVKCCHDWERLVVLADKDDGNAKSSQKAVEKRSREGDFPVSPL